jgi:hypothetical protein
LLFFDMPSFLVPSFWPRKPKLSEPSQGQAWFVVSLLCHPTRSSIVAFCFLDLQLSNTLSLYRRPSHLAAPRKNTARE